MAIEPPRLVLKTGALTRQQVAKVAIETINIVPGTSGVKIVDEVRTPYTTDPSWEGQLIVHHPTGSTSGVLYVAVKDVGLNQSF